PKRVQISERCAGWRESAISAWLGNPIFYSTNDQPSR
ncbi:AlpA family transcriptional regulator, partial [Sphingomonas sp. HMWF008]